MLLIGPTGSGKTPLGRLTEAEGLWGLRFVQFDFGERLRAAARPLAGTPLNAEQVATVRESLRTGALLTGEQFPIAEAVLRGFLAGPGPGARERVLLNGLPRHVGQARQVDRLLRVEAVVELACPDEVVLERIRRNTGGDRGGRTDDVREAVLARLATFRRDTQPLVAHYRAAGARVETVRVAADTTAADVRRELESRGAD